MKTTTIVACILLLAAPAHAMPPEQIKQILNLTKNSWVAFRDYNGRQWIYFTHLESYACGIRQVRYSINSDALDRTWELQPCNPKNPNAITKDAIYLNLPLGTARSVAVKLTFNDGSESEIVRKTP